MARKDNTDLGLLVTINNKGDLIKLLDEADDLSFKVVSKYLLQHNFEEVESRLLYDYQSGAGIGRVLRNIWIQYMNCSSKELIEQYKGATRKGELPHYETMLSMILVTFLSAIAANIIAIEYKEHRENILVATRKKFSKSQEHIKTISQNIKTTFRKPLRYLLRAFNLRDMVREGLVSREEHDKILAVLEDTELGGKVLTQDKKLNTFEGYETSYLAKHSIDRCEDILEELYEMWAQEYLTE